MPNDERRRRRRNRRTTSRLAPAHEGLAAAGKHRLRLPSWAPCLCEVGTKSFDVQPGGLQFARNSHPDSLHWAWPEWLRKHALPALRGKNLACFCPLDQPCHADVLLELANQQ
jgi:Domain of unknown function (DUF4326)